MNWTYIIDDKALPEGGKAQVFPLGVSIVVARVGGTVYAVEGKCPHMACPLFSGALDGYILTCPCHEWQFDVRTGQFLDAPEIKLALYPVKSEEGKLFVSLG
jgi:nitrite reductase/ring-hydroxylating ferredoxin subunit